jgi:hypothetical protein
MAQFDTTPAVVLNTEQMTKPFTDLMGQRVALEQQRISNISKGINEDLKKFEAISVEGMMEDQKLILERQQQIINSRTKDFINYKGNLPPEVRAKHAAQLAYIKSEAIKAKNDKELFEKANQVYLNHMDKMDDREGFLNNVETWRKTPLGERGVLDVTSYVTPKTPSLLDITKGYTPGVNTETYEKDGKTITSTYIKEGDIRKAIRERMKLPENEKIVTFHRNKDMTDQQIEDMLYEDKKTQLNTQYKDLTIKGGYMDDDGNWVETKPGKKVKKYDNSSLEYPETIKAINKVPDGKNGFERKETDVKPIAVLRSQDLPKNIIYNGSQYNVENIYWQAIDVPSKDGKTTKRTAEPYINLVKLEKGKVVYRETIPYKELRQYLLNNKQTSGWSNDDDKFILNYNVNSLEEEYNTPRIDGSNKSAPQASGDVQDYNTIFKP